MIGSSLAHYQITAKLGEGGMGEVYLADDTRLRRKVALKVLPEGMASDPDRRARLEREAQSIAALSHPNIVTIYSVEESESVFFITMERVKGEPLSRLIHEGGLSIQKLFEIAIPLADAVAAAHDQGITHRDLKPDNIMVDEAGRVKVLDFGLAKVTDEGAPGQAGAGATNLPTATVTAEGQVLGTVHYMSPEQAEGKKVDTMSDVFSLGIVLYEMATGSRPFDGDTPISTISAILKDTPGSVTDLRPQVPRHLDRIVRRCLHKDPERRYQSAKGLRNELEELKEEIDTGPVAAPATPAEDTSGGKRPGWLWPAMAGAAMVVAAVLGYQAIDKDKSVDSSSSEAVGIAETAPVSAASDRKMIVVLPFENLGEAEDDYFAAGVTEEITSRLGTASDLGVISGNSATLYRGTTKPTQQIGEELGVDYILLGKVRWARGAGDSSRVRITPQLIRVSDDVQIWADSFDETIDDVFTVQSRIANEVIEELGLALGGGQQPLISAKPTTENLEAWQAYLRGKQFNDARVGSNNTLAQQMLERAVELDPGFVDAWAELSKVHSVTMHMGVDISSERDATALEAAEVAMRLDPTSPSAHLAMGYYHYWGHKDYDAAMAEFDIAQRLLPNSYDVLSARGFVRRRKGDWQGALEDLERARELSPLDYRAHYEVGLTLLALGDYSGARVSLQQTLNIQPDFSEALFWSAQSHWVEAGDLDSGRLAVEAVPVGLNDGWVAMTRFLQPTLSRDPEAALATLETFDEERINFMPMAFPASFFSGWARIQMGLETEARDDLQAAVTYLEAMLDQAPDDYTAMPSLGLAYAMLGRSDDALAVGHRAVELYGMDRDRFFGLNVEIHVAWIEVLVGEHEAAIDRLVRVLAVPNLYLSAAKLRLDPIWDPLRDNPRFAALIED